MVSDWHTENVVTKRNKMKREIPLFIVDSSRKHKKGECDYICCTDKDSGFIAKIDYIDGELEETGSDYRIGLSKNGISCRMKIVRAMGENPTETAIRSLLKKGMEYYSTIIQKNVDVTKLSREDCVDCIDTIIKANMSLMKDRPLGQRQTIATSICVLEAAKKYIMEK